MIHLKDGVPHLVQRDQAGDTQQILRGVAHGTHALTREPVRLRQEATEFESFKARFAKHHRTASNSCTSSLSARNMGPNSTSPVQFSSESRGGGAASLASSSN